MYMYVYVAMAIIHVCMYVSMAIMAMAMYVWQCMYMYVWRNTMYVMYACNNSQ
jgi:hypothetical protein